MNKLNDKIYLAMSFRREYNTATFYEACFSYNMKLVKFMTKYHKNRINIMMDPSEGETIFELILGNGIVEVAEYVLDNYYDKIKYIGKLKDYNGMIYKIARNNYLEMIKFVFGRLEKFFDFDMLKGLLLKWSDYYNSMDIVNFIIEDRTNLKIAFDCICKKKFSKQMRYLLDNGYIEKAN